MPRARSAKLRAAERTGAAARSRRNRLVSCRACRRSPPSCGGAHDFAHPQSRGDRRARARGGLRLSHQIRIRPLQAERLAKMRDEVRHERDKIAALRARVGRARRSRAHPGSRQAFSQAKPIAPTQFDTLDHLPDRPPDYMQSGQRRSDRRHDRASGTAGRVTGSVVQGAAPPQTPDKTTAPPASSAGTIRNGQRMSATAEPIANPLPAEPAEPWLRRFKRGMLYGAQRRPRRQGARARRAWPFSALSSSTALSRRGSCCSGSSPRAARRSASSSTMRSRPRARTSSTATAKFSRPMCGCRRSYAEPRRIIDVDEAVELLTAALPDLDPTELRDAAFVQARLRLAQARHHAGAAKGNLSAGPAGHRLSEREQARLSERPGSLAPDRPRQHRQSGHRRHGEVARRPRPRGAAHGGPCYRPSAESGRACRRSARAARAA